MTNKALVVIFVFAVVASQLWAIFSRQDSWPMSNYPMYSEPRHKVSIWMHRLDAISEDGEAIPLKLNINKGTLFSYKLAEQQGKTDLLKELVMSDYKRNLAQNPSLDPKRFSRLRFFIERPFQKGDDGKMPRQENLVLIDLKSETAIAN